MDLTQLEMFNAVASTGSITQAAQKVHRVPSNLTTRIRQLEAKVERQAALLAQIDQVLDNPTLDAAEQRRQSEALMAHVLALREGR